jgi:hypothetical protein
MYVTASSSFVPVFTVYYMLIEFYYNGVDDLFTYIVYPI